MLHHQTFLRCSHRTAALILCAIIALFLLLGCAAMLRKTGIDQAEADRLAAIAEQNLAAAAAEAVHNIKTGIDRGHDIKSIAVKTTSPFAWKLATIGASTIGAVLSGLLAKWLGTEKKMLAATITGIEHNPTGNVKESVEARATARGVEKQLHRRVQALT